MCTSYCKIKVNENAFSWNDNLVMMNVYYIDLKNIKIILKNLNIFFI